ncbi:MAG: CCA tRNA nucleotidyltransferase [Alphaproteobacteria bacterium]
MKPIRDTNLLLIYHALNKQVRLVGGCVRDWIRGETPADFDLATPLSPDETLARLTAAGIKTALTGFKHGTVTALINHTPYEITSLRQDVSTDGRHAQVAFTDSYQVDARRRDFTINALYMDFDGTVYDYVGGQTDIARRYVRFIGTADERIREDYLRILRYFRFWGKLGHGATDVAAIQACSHYAPYLKNVSAQRKQEELFKILADRHCPETLSLMSKTGVLSEVLPHTDISALTAFLSAAPTADILERLAVLSAGVLPPLALSKAQTSLLTAFYRPVCVSDDTQAMRLLLYREEERPFLFHVKRAFCAGLISAATADKLNTLTKPVFPLTGRDLLKAGFTPGPALKRVLDTAVLIWASLDFCENKTLVLNKLLAYNKDKESKP